MLGLSGKGTSTMVIVFTNLIPVFGVLFFGWDAFMIVLLYWMENAVIGFFNIFKILFASGTMLSSASSIFKSGLLSSRVSPESLEKLKQLEEQQAKQSFSTPQAMKVFLVPFFTIHYGGFMCGHGVFIVAIFQKDALEGSRGVLEAVGGELSSVFSWGLAVALAALILEHGYNFFTDYWKGGRYKKTNAAIQMFKPYPRIFVLHIVIMVGGGLMVFLQLPRLTVILLIAFKIAFDLVSARISRGGQGDSNQRYLIAS
jgi:hypothetical protein